MKKPFIYIAALRRTGSKVLSEALSLHPYSFIFLEPRLGSGAFKIKNAEVEIFAKYGIDLLAFQDQISRVDRKLSVEYFKNELMPKLLQVFSQIGIKEIHHKYWKSVYNTFPDMKIILTARDPRDIYLSLYHKSIERNKEIRVEGGFTPQNLVLNLKEDFEYQMEMFNTTRCLKVKYEDFCTDRMVYEQVKAFVESNIPAIGIVGHLSKQDHLIHGYDPENKRTLTLIFIIILVIVFASDFLVHNLKDYCR